MTSRRLPIALAASLALLAGCGSPETSETTTPAETGAAEPAAPSQEGAASEQQTDAARANPSNGLPNGLDGRWVSVDDPQSELLIEGTTAEMIYEGEALSTDTIAAVDACESAPDAAGAMLLEMRPAEGEPLCYSLYRLSETELVLTYLPRGNTLEYRRAD
ncbi:hypothetical protein WNY37_07465 [Henriciella sp. AS95]|uniref:hypothetical protein n=1 Tax=Henriciella sp. AS95 TaxID=3135782 RepID=UPI003173BA00